MGPLFDSRLSAYSTAERPDAITLELANLIAWTSHHTAEKDHCVMCTVIEAASSLLAESDQSLSVSIGVAKWPLRSQ